MRAEIFTSPDLIRGLALKRQTPDQVRGRSGSEISCAR